jgi:hypothetical protein
MHNESDAAESLIAMPDERHCSDMLLPGLVICRLFIKDISNELCRWPRNAKGMSKI